MSEQEKSQSYKTTFEALRKIEKKLVDLLSTDLSKIHVSNEWSLIPHINDHLQFLVEQVDGLIQGLQDSPPPPSPTLNANE